MYVCSAKWYDRLFFLHTYTFNFFFYIYYRYDSVKNRWDEWFSQSHVLHVESFNYKLRNKYNFTSCGNNRWLYWTIIQFATICKFPILKNLNQYKFCIWLVNWGLGYDLVPYTSLWQNSLWYHITMAMRSVSPNQFN